MIIPIFSSVFFLQKRKMKDYLVRGLVNSKNCRVFACQTTNLLEEARKDHDLWPTASAALGRMMSATLMMAAMNKNNEKIGRAHV